MNRKLVAETVKADELVIRYLNENEKRMRIIKKKKLEKLFLRLGHVYRPQSTDRRRNIGGRGPIKIV